MKVSGFTYIHNAMTGGYPIIEAISAIWHLVDEVVVVDVECTDNTIDVIRRRFPHKVRIVEGVWLPGQAGECLKLNHSRYFECEGDYIIHFEADEVFDPKLAEMALNALLVDPTTPNVAVYRLQVEQNFQRVRWWPEPVHRIFKRDPSRKIIKKGHTTRWHMHRPQDVQLTNPIYGYLWDVTNCFRDSYKTRCRQQSTLWGEPVTYRVLEGLHSASGCTTMNEATLDDYLKQPIWTYMRSPLELPDSLRELVGVTNYAAFHR